MSHKQKQKKVSKCKRCGKCCIVKGEQNTWFSCRYLVKTIYGTTFCPIYRHRLGVIIGEKQFCWYRKEWKHNIPDCPFNKENLNTHPAYK